MAVKMNLWSLTLLPGERYPLMVPRDFQITNVALGEELRSESGRSVVKVTHHPIPESAFDDSDSEFDSDDDEDDEDDDEDDDDEDLEGSAELAAALKKAVKADVKANGAKGKGKDAADAEEDDEEDDEFEGAEDDDEDEDSLEDDEDFSDDDDVEETSVMCSLIAGKVEQAAVNLTFVEGDVVMFETTGENVVHLLGNYINQFPDEDSDSDSEIDSDEFDDYSDLDDSLLDDEELDGPSIEEIDEVEVDIKPKPKAKAIAPVAEKPKKEKAAAPAAAVPAVAATKRKAEDAADVSMTSNASDGLSKNQKKKLAKKAKTEGDVKAESKPAAAAAAAPAKAAQPSKRTLPSGLIIEDITVGSGPVAKAGRRLSMRYIGKLENGKQFDANTGGKPFSFVLGRGEVIKGWDQGLAGMATGGERRLTIPANLAYGSQKIPGIPKNSTLKFDVKLVSVA